MKREVRIEIAGQALTLRSDDDDRYVKSLAAYVDEKIREVGQGQQSVTTLTLALTAALMIADELQKSRAAQQEVDGTLDRLSGVIEASLADAGS
jgi:cell division protein ZapA